MTFAEPLVVRIPRTRTFVLVPIVGSWNTFGASRWTDTRLIGPCVPDNPPFRVHLPTGRIYWTSECEEIPFSKEHSSLAYADEADAGQIFAALDAGTICSTKKQRVLRIHAWWLQNDPWRQSFPAAAPNHPPAFRANLVSLRALLDPGKDNDVLLTAEIARELGDFKECARLLDRPFPENIAFAADKIRSLAAAGDSLVRSF